MATTIIPEDIIATHILHHLPSKSIGQFRCVSKRWLSILTDPHFIQTHQKTLDRNRHVIFKSHDGLLYYSVPFYNHAEAVPTIIELPLQLHHLNIYGSINGLVLASGYKTLSTKGFAYLFFNPITKDYVELPSSLHEQLVGMKGFGYDSVSGDYKVVVFSNCENCIGDVYLYNLRTNTMKLVTSKSPYQVYHHKMLPPGLFFMLPGVFVNGFLHWIINNHSKQEEELVIVAFSLADEKFTELAPPSQVDLSDIYTMLVSLGDKLAIFHLVKGEIWVMNEYGVNNSWTKILVNEFNEILSNKPIFFFDKRKVLFLIGDLLEIYDVEEGTYTKSVDLSYMEMKSILCAYSESLVSPKFSNM